MPFETRGLRFPVDVILNDGVGGVVVARPSQQPGEGAVHLALRERALEPEGFEATLLAERRALMRQLANAEVVERTALKIQERPARLYTWAGNSGDGLPLRYLQGFLLTGDACVVLTAIGYERHLVTLREVFEQILADVEKID